MTDLISNLLCATLAFGSGIFVVLSLLERPIWPLMWARQSDTVLEEDMRTVHAILKRVIHLLPPTMITTMSISALLFIALLVLENFDGLTVLAAVCFFVQQALVAARLAKDIAGVDTVDSQGDIDAVRMGLGALALLHHRGLLLTVSSLVLVVVSRAL